MLDVQWLRTLGTILWDFDTLFMKFTWDNEEVSLHGLLVGEVEVAIKKQTMRLSHTTKGTYTVLMTLVDSTEPQALTKMHQWLEEL